MSNGRPPRLRTLGLGHSSVIGLCSLVILLGLCPSVGSGHQVPRSEYDRNVTVKMRTDGVIVVYRVELDEYTLVTTVGNPLNGFPLKPTGKVGRKDVADAFLTRMKEVIPDQLVGTLDGRPLSLACTAAHHAFPDPGRNESVQFFFTLKATATLGPGAHKLELDDLNFMDKKGRLSMKVEVVEPLVAESLSEIAEQRLTGVDNGKQGIAATVRLLGDTPGPPPALEVTPEVQPAPPQPTPAGFWDLFRRVNEEESLAILLDTDVGLWVVLLLAFLHGILHSVSPGHGKTMVAAYLVGEQGTPRHAVILGLIVTLTHTSAAFAVALLLRFVLTDTAPATIQSVLGLGGGALVVFIGLWLLMQRLAGRSDHVHAFGSHSHGHGHSHSHGDGHGHAHSHGLTPEQFGRVGWLRLVLLGISGGVVPCWGAILWVLYCVTAGRYGLAIWAVLAFSVGLASVLVLLGLSVVWGGRAGASRFGGTKWFRVVSKWLPIVGAALVVAIGLLLCKMHLPK